MRKKFIINETNLNQYILGIQSYTSRDHGASYSKISYTKKFIRVHCD